MSVSLKHTFRRINRKYRQIVNLSITAIFLIVICGVIVSYQSHVSKLQLDEASRINTFLHDAVLARQDSILLEVDRLKIGVSDAQRRTFKITTAANEIRLVRQSMSETEAIKLAALVYDECERSGVEFSYALAIIYVESRFNHTATSEVGAQGLMQIMPLTFVSVAKIHGYDYLETDITDLKKNVRVGTLFLHRLFSKTGSYDLTSAGYNGGPKAAANYKRMLAGDTSAHVPMETQNYVVAVIERYAYYKKALGE